MHKGLKIVGGSLLAAWLALNPGHALAQKNKEEATSIPQNRGSYKKEAWMQAGEYAKSNPAVGVAVYGRSSDATGQQVGEFIQAVLAKQGINSQLFLADSERLGVGVSFYIKDMSYGPTGLDKAGQNIRTVIEHFPQAWPDYQMPRERPAQQPDSSYR